MKSLIIKSSRAFNGKYLVRAVTAAVVLLLGLTACAPTASKSYEREVPTALKEAGMGVQHVDLSSYHEGFVRHIMVVIQFDRDDLSVEQLKKSLLLTSEHLGQSGGTKVQFEFDAPNGEPMTDITGTVESFNDELGLAGDERLNGTGSIFRSMTVEELDALVARF